MAKSVATIRRDRESGASLVEILVAMAIAGLVLAAGASFFESSQKTAGTESAVLSLERQADRIHNLLATQIENAGFGFPQSCGESAVLSDWPGMTGPTGGNTWYSMAGTSSGGLSWISSANSLGNVAVASITDMPSMNSDSFQVSTVANLSDGEGLAAEVPGLACFVSYIHSLSTSSGQEVTYVKLPNGSWGDLAQAAGVSVSAAQMLGARVYGLGNIVARNLELNGNALQETLSGQETNWQPQTVTLSNRVLAWQVQVATGSPLQWESAATWESNAAQGNAPSILAVQIGMVLASQNQYPGAQTPTQVSLLGNAIPVSSAWSGHLLQSFVWTFPVPNNLWSAGNA
jgi:type II secretory pathway pseudopilin PulG